MSKLVSFRRKVVVRSKALGRSFVMGARVFLIPKRGGRRK